MKEKLDNLEIKKRINKEESKNDWRTVIIILIFVVLIPMILLTALSIHNSLNPKVPSLSNYNKLELGMSYKECKDILKVEGHRTKENKDEMTYEWYDPDCEDGLFSKCGWIVRLKFKNDKLVEREEDGLK